MPLGPTVDALIATHLDRAEYIEAEGTSIPATH
jgi:hypothetical protein